MAIFLFIFLLLMVAYIIILGYYHEHWKDVPLTFTEGGEKLVVSGPYKVSTSHTRRNANELSIAVIVPVRNEEVNLSRLVTTLLGQYIIPRLYEVIIVDDHSEDDTLQIARSFSHEALRVLELPEHLSGKKAAINFGINNTDAELIVTTDADCNHQPLWIHAISEAYLNTSAKFIVGPVKMTSRNTFLGIFQRLDFMMLQGITGASVHSGLHCMCNGANLAYERSAFIHVNGFDGIDHIPSGDDMLLMYKIKKRWPQQICYLKNQAAIVSTAVEPTWPRFFQQRIRWSSKAVHYDDKKIFMILVVTYLVNVCFLALTLASIIAPFYAWILLLFFVMKIISEFPLASSTCAFFNERKLLYLFPLFQPFHILYIVIAGWLGQFGSYKWKSRVVKNTGRSKLLKQ